MTRLVDLVDVISVPRSWIPTTNDELPPLTTGVFTVQMYSMAKVPSWWFSLEHKTPDTPLRRLAWNRPVNAMQAAQGFIRRQLTSCGMAGPACFVGAVGAGAPTSWRSVSLPP